MTKFRSILFAAVCLAVLSAPFAMAQTYTVSTYQGNGQMVCDACPFYTYQYFDPMVAQVVDQNGVPAANQTVTWYLYSGSGSLATNSTVTDSNGLTSNVYYSILVGGTTAQPYITNEIVATIQNSTAYFYEIQVLGFVNSGYVPAQAGSIGSVIPTSISGAAGSTGTPILIYVTSSGTPMEYAEIRLYNSQTSPSVSCATGPGADPGTVLTDATGLATCNPILAGSGRGSFEILVGGVASWSEAPGTPVAFWGAGPLGLTVTAAAPGSIQVVSGNNQSAVAGQSLSSPLVAVLRDTSGNSLAAQAVTWSVSPANAGTFTNASTVSNSTGYVQTGFTFSGTASGSVTVTVAVTGSSIKSTFALTAIPSVTYVSITKVSGDGQTTTSGQTFTNPLVVQVAVTSGSAANATVSFTATANATLSASSATTNSNGQAQVSVTAPTTTSQESVTVTASVGNLSQTFTLTVNPQGPTLSAFVNAADQKVGSLSPCSLAKVIGSGVAPSIQGTTVGASFGPGPLTLAGASLTVSGTQAPIFSIANNSGSQSLTFQVPCEVTALSNATVIMTVNGGTGQANVPILAASPGVYGALGSDNVMRATLVRQDGSFVSLSNPARRGESVTAYVTGLGPTTPAVGTNQIPPIGITATVNGIVVPGLSGGGTTLNYARLTSDLVGVYEVSFVVPANLSTGNSIGFSIGVIPVGASTAQYSNLIYIPVQ